MNETRKNTITSTKQAIYQRYAFTGFRNYKNSK